MEYFLFLIFFFIFFKTQFWKFFGQFIDTSSIFRIYLQTFLNKLRKLFRIASRNLLINTFLNFFLKIAHTVGRKRRVQICQFINNTAETPDITFWIVPLTHPNFRTNIIRSSGLSLSKIRFADYGYVKVADFDLLSTLGQKNVGCF